MITNLDRANWADKAILAFREQTGCDHEDSLGDLLGDLMHWAAVRNFDFHAALDRARHHHQEEREEENSTDRLPEAVQDLIEALEHQTPSHAPAQENPFPRPTEMTVVKANKPRAMTTRYLLPTTSHPRERCEV
jgi:hypothetical protein